MPAYPQGIYVALWRATLRQGETPIVHEPAGAWLQTHAHARPLSQQVVLLAAALCAAGKCACARGEVARWQVSGAHIQWRVAGGANKWRRKITSPLTPNATIIETMLASFTIKK